MGEFDEFEKPSVHAGGDFSEFEQAAQPEERSFLGRAADTIKSGARAVGHVAHEGIRELEGRAARAFGLDTRGTPMELPTDEHRVSARRELERGVDQMATLGYGQKIAGAAEDTNFGRAMSRAMGGPQSAFSPEQAAADQAEAPGYRTVGTMAGMGLPGAASGIAGATGRIARPLTNAIGRGGEKLAEQAARIPYAGPVVAPAIAGAGGAARGIVGYEAAAPLTAALSADATGHRHEAFHEAASDPLGIVTSAAAGGIPAASGQAVKGAQRYVEHAPTAADEWIVKDIRGQRAGDSTPTARKYLAADEADVQAVVKSDPKLRGALEAARHGDKAKLEAAAQTVDHKIAEVNAPRTEAYDKHVDGALGGGIRAGDFIGDLRRQAAELTADGTAGGHSMSKYLEARADELERSRDWGAKGPTEHATASPEELATLERVRNNVAERLKGGRAPSGSESDLANIDRQIAALKNPNHSPDAIVPTRKARAVVSDIQDAAYDGLGGLSSTRSSGQARHVAGVVKDVFDKYLDTAAQKSPEAAQAVDQIRAINVQHGALKNIQRVIDQRLNKATQNAQGASGSEMLKHGFRGVIHSPIGIAIAERAYHGHPGQAAAVAGAAALPAAKRALDTHVAGHQAGYLSAVKRLASLARSATDAGDFIREAVSAGLGVDDARRIYEKAHPTQQPN